MNKLIDDLIGKGMGRLMNESRDALAMADETYQNDRKAEDELEKRYESLELSKAQRILINDYITCASTVNHRYADIAYMAGIRDTVGMLASLGLIKDVEVER